MISFGRNISALGAARQLDATGNSLSRSFERLASGQRINRASDDAAGLAIAESLKNRAGLYGTSVRNINDGISALNIASSTLSDQTAILHRLSELAEQAANGTYSSKQRASADTEYQALVAEFGRLGEAASFNGISLLLAGRNSGSSGMQLQTGIDGRSSSTLTVQTGNSGNFSGDIYAYTLMGTGVARLAGARYSLQEVYDFHNSQMAKTTVTDASGTTRELLLGIHYEAGSIQLDVYAKEEDIGPPGTAIGDPGSESTIAGTGGWVILQSGPLSTDATGAVSTTTSIDLAFSPSYFAATLNLDLRGARFLKSSSPAPLANITGNTSSSSAVNFSGVDTAARALSALSIVQTRLAQLGTLQGQIGAAQSRLTSSLNLSAVSKENTSAAESRIRDADIASESAQLTANQIKQQTAAQVLALASRQPTLAINLLQGI